MSLNIKDLFLLKKLIPYTYIKIDTTKTLEEYQKQTIDLINKLNTDDLLNSSTKRKFDKI